MDVGQMVDRIQALTDINKMFGFTHIGVERRSWSQQFMNAKGEVLETRGSDWVLYCLEYEVLAEGVTPAELKLFLLGRSTTEELVKMLMER
jgi:hypothetical protein